MTEKQGQSMQQATIMLSYFEEELPVLYLSDGAAYLPVRVLCRMLGLRAETHIPRWRKLVLWANARKLPLQTARGQRNVWCLHSRALPFWCACFNWSLVTPVRREQLRQATDAWLEEVEQAQQLMLDCYRSLRQYLFEFLEAYSDAETRLKQWALCLSSSLDTLSSAQLRMLLSQGYTLIEQATAQARKMVQEQAMMPVVDIITVDVYGAVTETGTLPLFPVVCREDREQFFAYVGELTRWHQDLVAFIVGLILSRESDQSEEA
jgi:hypothetical protein